MPFGQGDLFLRTDFLHAGPTGIAVMLLVGVRNGGFFSFFPGCKAGAVPAFQAVHTVGAEHVIRFIGGAGIGLRMVPHGGGVDTQYGAHKTEEQGGENSAVNTFLPINSSLRQNVSSSIFLLRFTILPFGSTIAIKSAA